ncbi:pyridine nucleotide-disulfide oxidoreductase [Schizophyllum amplum]|uniref:Pyridine nucleotide-disulfide oxidoreductase n=1 Tax=Schizophyllum amplum TaxID=97359 RepID=A0A550CQG5_9AGAR|nr:pyridine nucleotide-disulfide oxidoreductase [Auriculariopsis ampla]
MYSRLSTPMSHLNGSSIARSRVVIIGSGWAGYTLTQQLNDSKYDITVISPHQTFQCTPLLASAATGLFFSRLAEEPIRSAHRHLTYYRALATAADFDNKTVTCIPSSLNPATGYDEPQPDALFDVQYDKLVIAPGCQNQTFGTPGAEHCFFLKSVADADAIRRKILSLVEEASLPNVLEARVRELLHFIVVGGGPTGIELSAELDDLTTELEKTYSHLRDKFSITVHDVAPEILGAFDRKLKEYAMGSLARHGMEVKTNSHIERVEKGAIHTKEEGRIGCGLVAWVTGNKQTDFVGGLAGLAKADKTHRVLTDQRLRVLKEDRTVIEDVFALGDMADILDKGLPATAEGAFGHLPRRPSGPLTFVTDCTFSQLLCRRPNG